MMKKFLTIINLLITTATAVSVSPKPRITPPEFRCYDLCYYYPMVPDCNYISHEVETSPGCWRCCLNDDQP
ncbi:hypothetical protein K443DRAFT_680963 [Laccaria amethystina LaAM-08-1]|uniref:Uncharacterized protein n=1 Tax=Laccaria amethystina LaAM-08-1 TaxID=1095629 RepID=A0A0C9WMH0_9AGAR|nr:hypothetical protein K443DRAFT_680963 [Laccaria amethystina LaAM-08-1]